ncbi:ComEC/Rec2 family competence protein [uncultured Rhodoblastus sp.]|uniref:ComEC/Rec2 family competence protein n=1 Tax=uncultured Rhodoblastus sp. TaxID=543037 RepID=UPI0025D44C60|nr:ComEC/Rec2 family competence protein [uncultured Rhodoblastus sp.]
MASAPRELTGPVSRGGAGAGWSFRALLRAFVARAGAALEEEWALRRPFLWLPAAMGAGAIFYLVAATEPALWVVGPFTLICAALARLAREKRAVFACLAALAALGAGETFGAWRAARVDAPVLDRVLVGEVAGFVEEVDFRAQGARFLLRVSEAQGLAPDKTPFRMRLTSRGRPNFAAGDFVVVKARLLPPAHPSLPGGYDFARDAYFARIGAVGNTLTPPQAVPPPESAGWRFGFFAAVDRARNALALRVADAIGGDNGAIGAAMVTGKRDLLSEEAKETIRKAGIFHIITISGVQMTLVAGIFFVGLRRLMAFSPTLALNYPIKKWAAGLAIAGACLYALFTGSRVGSERALFMTLILLGSVLADRPALTMRNLAFAALAVIVLQPEALLGASFQLSFAAVAALVAVYESRAAARSFVPGGQAGPTAAPREREARALAQDLAERSRHGVFGALFATFCATSATASFMAYDFHELSPYVLIGNPLTLAMIELFAVPAALLGSVLYPFGLDAWVWSYLGAGIAIVMKIAGWIGAAPGASISLPAFAPWSIVCLTLAVLSAVLWRTALMRLTALPLLALGLLGAASGGRFDLAVPPSGDMAALRDADGQLTLLGKKNDAFAAEQWLRADADPRNGAERAGHCDALGCVGRLRNGESAALVLDYAAFHEDCARAQVVISPLYAPRSCAPKILLDRARLAETGAVTLAFGENGVEWRTARAPGENRPWSPAPRRRVIAASTPHGVSRAPVAARDDDASEEIAE